MTLALMFIAFFLSKSTAQETELLIPIPDRLNPCTHPPAFIPSGVSLCSEYSDFQADITIGSVPNSTSYTANLGLGANVANKKIYVYGTLYINSEIKFSNCIFKMHPRATIRTWNNFNFQAYTSKFFSCEQMWRGIKIYGSSSAIIWDCEIEDAEIAVLSFSGNQTINSYSTIYNRNYIGIKDGESVTPNTLTLGWFIDNSFTFTAPLNMPYPGQTLYREVPYAGIWLTNCTSTIGISGASNTFSDLQFGIVGNNCNLLIQRCSFKNMVETHYGNNVYHGGSGILLNRGSAVINGYNETCADSYWAGLQTYGTTFRLENYNFSGKQQFGVLSYENDNNQGIIMMKNNFFLDHGDCVAGIWLERSASSNPNYITNSILNNTFTYPAAVTEYGLGWGIYVDVVDPALDEMDIFNNTFNINSSSIYLKGIYISSLSPGQISNRFKIKDNSIYFNGSLGLSLPPGGASMQGIMMADITGTEHEISNNKVDGSFAGDYGGACAIHLTKTPNVTICDNDITHTWRGLHFQEGNDPLKVSVTDIGFHEQGLFLESGAIGDQVRRGNIWDVGATAYGAFAAECTGLCNYSIFYVEDGTNPSINPPDVFPTNGWFIPQAGSTQYCTTGNAIISGSILSAYDQGIIDGTAFDASMSEPEKWELRYDLMLKLLRHPELITGNALSFYNTYVTSNLLHLARVQMKIDTAFRSAQSLEILLDSTNQARWKCLDSMAVLINQLGTPSFQNPSVSQSWTAAFNNITATLNALSTQAASTASQIIASRLTWLNLAGSFNNGLTGLTAYEEKRRLWNNTLIQIYKGNQPIQSDITTFSGWTSQSKEIVGSLGLEVLALLPICAYPEPSDEPAIVSQRNTYKHHDTAVVATSPLKAFPNPANTVLTIQLPVVESGELYWSDITGRIIRRQPVPMNTAQLDLDVSDLAPGLYILIWLSTSGEQISAKIVVQR